MVRQTAALPKFSDTYVDHISIRGRGCRLRPSIGFVSPKKFHDYTPVTVASYKTFVGQKKYLFKRWKKQQSQNICMAVVHC